MKKIFTLLLFAGFLSTASFAQTGHSPKSKGQTNGNGYQTAENYRNTNNHQYSQYSFNDSRNYSENNRNHQQADGYYGDTNKQPMRTQAYNYPHNYDQRSFKNSPFRSNNGDRSFHERFTNGDRN